MRAREFDETVNPAVFKRGFEKTKPYGKYTLVAKHGALPYIPGKKASESDQFRIEAYNGKAMVGWVNFKVNGLGFGPKDHSLEAIDLNVESSHRRKGIATAMYKFANELGNDIRASSMQTSNGKDFWGGRKSMRAQPVTEGGWASAKTQNTVITPQVVEAVVAIMKGFEQQFNKFLQQKNLPSIEVGHPCGSATYYERDLAQQPDKHYGDVDIHFYIPQMPGMNNHQTVMLFANAVKEFCDMSQAYETDNGKNVVVKIGENDYVQVDLVISYSKLKHLGKALAPEWNVKGVLSTSLYSALAEALHLSIGSHGVQAKILNGERVKFTTMKGVELHHVTDSTDSWAIDIAAYLGCKKFSPRLKQYPGLIGEVRVADIVNSVRGIAESLELNGIMSANELLTSIKQIYLGKIEKTIHSSKFDKASSPAAVAKAEETKQLLAQKSSNISRLLGV